MLNKWVRTWQMQYNVRIFEVIHFVWWIKTENQCGLLIVRIENVDVQSDLGIHASLKTNRDKSSNKERK